MKSARILSAKTIVIGAVLFSTIIACQNNSVENSAVNSNTLETFGAFGDGYPNSKSPCRRLGETDKTREYLDHTRILVGCPGSSKNKASKRVLAINGASLVDEIDGVTLISLPD